MDLIKIKNELEKNGFVSYIRETTIYAGIEGKTDEELGIKTMTNSFRIAIHNDKIKLEYAYGQLPVEKYYNSIEDLIISIKQTFPLTEN